MKKHDNNVKAFFALIRAGLWEKDVKLLPFGKIDYSAIYKLAEEQSVVGLVAGGLEHVTDAKVSKETILQFVGSTLQIEQQNKAMNTYVARLIELLRKNDIYALLVKGQGIAQCYEKPLWRATGDIDLFLSNDNYKKAKDLLIPNVYKIDEEDVKRQHLSMTIESWVVELHGTLRSGLWKTVDKGLDDIQRAVFYDGKVRSWLNGKTQIFLPKPDEDIIFVFSHILQHFYKEGIGLRQICDWCRLIWTYKGKVDRKLLEQRLKSMGVMTEWKAFSSLAVNYLGMPVEAFPFYSDSRKWSRKADKIMDFILETGNFGHNRDLSYMQSRPYIIRKLISLWRHTADSLRYFFIFPLDSLMVWCVKVRMGFMSLVLNK